jgi:hypothetical protein
LALPLLALTLAGCKKQGTFALLEIAATQPSLAPATIDLQISLGGRSITHTLREPTGGAISLPTSIGVSITNSIGTMSVDAAARDQQGRALAVAIGSGVIAPGRTTTIALDLRGDATPDGGGTPDAASADLAGAQSSGQDGGVDAGPSIVVMPAAATVTIGRKQQFTASSSVTWAVMESGGGTVSASGLYSAPTAAGVYHLLATSAADSSQTAAATINVSDADIELMAGDLGGPGNLDGVGALARFDNYGVVTVNETLGIAYIVSVNALRKMDLASKTVTTTLSGAQIPWQVPAGVATYVNGDLYVSDMQQHVIYKVPFGTMPPTVFVGTVNMSGLVNGAGPAARLDGPRGLALDANAHIFCADSLNNAIRVIDTLGNVTTLAGGSQGYQEGTGSAAKFNLPTDVAVDNQASVFVTDSSNDVVRKVDIASGTTSFIAGMKGISTHHDGSGMGAAFAIDTQVAADYYGNLWVNEGTCFSKVQLSTGNVSTPIGQYHAPASSVDGVGLSVGMEGLGHYHSIDSGGNIYMLDGSALRTLATTTLEVTTIAGSNPQSGHVDGVGAAARFNGAGAIAADDAGNLYIADDTIRRVSSTTGAVTTVAGKPGVIGYADGTASTAAFGAITGLAVVGTKVYIADWYNNVIRVLDVNENIVSTFAGSLSPETVPERDGVGAQAIFRKPWGLVSDGQGNLFVADDEGCTIREIEISSQRVSTFAGQYAACSLVDETGTAARFFEPTNLGTDGKGNLYTADWYNHVIRRINISTGYVKTIAGVAGSSGNKDGTGSAALFAAPQAAVGDASGRVYVADRTNNNIRVLTPGAGDTYTTDTIVGTAGLNGFRLGAPPGVIYQPSGVALTAAGDLAFTTDGAVLLRRLAPQ